MARTVIKFVENSFFCMKSRVSSIVENTLFSEKQSHFLHI